MSQREFVAVYVRPTGAADASFEALIAEKLRELPMKVGLIIIDATTDAATGRAALVFTADGKEIVRLEGSEINKWLEAPMPQPYLPRRARENRFSAGVREGAILRHVGDSSSLWALDPDWTTIRCR